MHMKRFIVVVALALSSAPVLAEHRDSPFEQNELDRALPSVSENVSAYEPIASDRMPFEQTQLDRAILGTPETVQLAAVGGMSYKSDEGGESPWTSDHNFIAPAQ
jgi:hypothetical protein